MVQHKPTYSRRALSRINAPDDLWVCWRCNGRDDISRVLDLSPDGLFIHTTHQGLAVGMTAKLDFLVQEGRLRAEATVRHVKRSASGGSGLGLKFTAWADEDRCRLKTLLTRLRSNSTSAASGQSSFSATR